MTPAVYVKRRASSRLNRQLAQRIAACGPKPAPLARGLLSMPQAATLSAACGDSSGSVDPQTLIPMPAPRLIIPEGVSVRLRVEHAVCVGQTEIEESSEPRARFGPAESIVTEADRVVNIVVRRTNIIVAGQNERDLAAQQLAGVSDQPLHPGELVGELVGPHRIAVWQVDRSDANLAKGRLDIPRLLTVPNCR